MGLENAIPCMCIDHVNTYTEGDVASVHILSLITSV